MTSKKQILSQNDCEHSNLDFLIKMFNFVKIIRLINLNKNLDVNSFIEFQIYNTI